MKKMKKSEVVVFKSFIEKKDTIVLHNWILELFQKNLLTQWNVGYFMGGYRIHDPEDNIWGKDEHNRELKCLQDIPELFFSIHEKISKKTGFDSVATIRKKATSTASAMTMNGYVSYHKDTHVEDHVHIRANVMLNCNVGGYPVIDRTMYKLEQGDLIIFAADFLDHCTTAQESTEPRTIVSFPFLIPDNWFS